VPYDLKKFIAFTRSDMRESFRAGSLAKRRMHEIQKLDTGSHQDEGHVGLASSYVAHTGLSQDFPGLGLARPR